MKNKLLKRMPAYLSYSASLLFLAGSLGALETLKSFLTFSSTTFDASGVKQ